MKNKKIKKFSFWYSFKRFRIILDAEVKYFFTFGNLIKNLFSIVFPLLILVLQISTFSSGASTKHGFTYSIFFGSQFLSACFYIIFWRIRNIVSQKIFVNRSFISYQLFSRWSISLSKIITEGLFFILGLFLIFGVGAILSLALGNHLSGGDFLFRIFISMIIIFFSYMFIKYIGELLLYSFNKESIGKFFSVIFVILATIGMILVNSFTLWWPSWGSWLQNKNNAFFIQYIPFFNFANIGNIWLIGVHSTAGVNTYTYTEVDLLKTLNGLVILPLLIMILSWKFYIRRAKKYLCSFI